ncbi:hypothetical protein M513_01040 [Trichuris suis]|uniref:Uncharacterized protein n=1 Tax=Trichuris suis TaxID=68888 RepID=A0A085MM31_9BILA|nr:hypothetical protein M513_01040 [Trichuris suis]
MIQHNMMLTSFCKIGATICNDVYCPILYYGEEPYQHKRSRDHRSMGQSREVKINYEKKSYAIGIMGTLPALKDMKLSIKELCEGNFGAAQNTELLKYRISRF